MSFPIPVFKTGRCVPLTCRNTDGCTNVDALWPWLAGVGALQSAQSGRDSSRCLDIKDGDWSGFVRPLLPSRLSKMDLALTMGWLSTGFQVSWIVMRGSDSRLSANRRRQLNVIYPTSRSLSEAAYDIGLQSAPWRKRV
jgi:hypothetical protein